MRKTKTSFTWVVISILILLATTSGWAAGQLINYQGELTDAGGAPVTANFPITFSLWNNATLTDVATYRIWEEQQSVSVVNGIFSVQLGKVTSLPSAVTFTSPNLYLEVSVAATVLGPRTQLTTTPASFWAEESGNAATLAGQNASAFAPVVHAHSHTDVTGTVEYVDGRIAALVALITAQQEQIDLLLNVLPLSPEDLAQLSTDFSLISSRVDQLEDTNTARSVIDDLVPFLSVTGNDVFLTNANFNIQNGAGTTNTVTGTGNLVLGYNAPGASNNRTGSHNLIIGDKHSYSSYAGLVAGEENSILSPYASIAGGTLSKVQASHGAILGGFTNTVDGMYGIVAGGVRNTINTTAQGASILGGIDNQTNAPYSSIVGGSNNVTGLNASGAAILGGESNSANGEISSLLGGYSNAVDGFRSTLTGGSNQTVGNGQEIGPIISPYQEIMTLEGDTLKITGVNVQIVNGRGTTQTADGTGNLILGYNTVNPLGVPIVVPGGRTGSHNLIVGDGHNYDANGGIVGGMYNYLGSTGVVFGLRNEISALAADGVPGNASILGGAENIASGQLSAILGGNENISTGEMSAVVGGFENDATGKRTVAVGGDHNVADTLDAVTVGGSHNRAGGTAAVVVGGQNNTAEGQAAAIGGGMGNRAVRETSAIPTGKYIQEGGQ